MKYKTAVFDMDGTILNTLDDLADATNATLAHFGYPERSVDEVRQFVGNGTRKLIEQAVPPETSEADIGAAFKWFGPYYQTHADIKTKAYPGIEALLRDLRANGVQTAVVSNKPDAAVKKLALQYFDGLFDIAIGENEAAGIRRKPAPDSVDAALDALGADRADAVYIGDSDVDLATAQNAGMDHILVTWGFRDKAFLKACGAEIFADTPRAVLALILDEKHEGEADA
jgi:phosphoglycolate phosphatase